MIYTPLTKKAMRIAYEAHHGQVDKVGVPYIFHPMHLAEQMKEEYTTCAALLHDVVEDTDYTLEDLEKLGFCQEILDALALMTHDPKVPYMEYVRALRKNPIARKVKMADLKHNSDLNRIEISDEAARAKAEKRVEKYRIAQEILQEVN